MPDTATHTTPVVPLEPAPSTSDKVVAGATLAGNTALITAAPLLNNINPSINPSGAGGLAVSMIGNGILCIVQAFAVQDWFDDHKWAVWACILGACIICGILYIGILHDVEKGVLNALGAMYQAASNYGPLRQLGVFNRGENIGGKS
jgi:hypothetical protein